MVRGTARPGGVTRIDLKRLRELRAQGLTIAQLALRFGVSDTAITKALERAGKAKWIN